MSKSEMVAELAEIINAFTAEELSRFVSCIVSVLEGEQVAECRRSA